jgi:hypothetical protein
VGRSRDPVVVVSVEKRLATEAAIILFPVAVLVVLLIVAGIERLIRRARRPDVLPPPTPEAARNSQTYFTNALRTGARY